MSAILKNFKLITATDRVTPHVCTAHFKLITAMDRVTPHVCIYHQLPVLFVYFITTCFQVDLCKFFPVYLFTLWVGFWRVGVPALV